MNRDPKHCFKHCTVLPRITYKSITMITEKPDTKTDTFVLSQIILPVIDILKGRRVIDQQMPSRSINYLKDQLNAFNFSMDGSVYPVTN